MNRSLIQNSTISQQGINSQLPFNSEVLYEKDLDISVKINSASQSHAITFSCLLPRGSNGSRIKLLFTSKDDLFFLYTLDINKDKILGLNAQYGLKLQNVEDFLDMFSSLLEQVDQGKKEACLKFSNQNTLTLEIATIINGKQFLILALVASKESYESIQAWTAFKYGQMREEIKRSEHKIYQLRELIRVKNPYLGSYIDKIGK